MTQKKLEPLEILSALGNALQESCQETTGTFRVMHIGRSDRSHRFNEPYPWWLDSFDG